MTILRTTFALVCLIAVTACSPSGSDNKAAPPSEAPALRTTPLVAQSPAAQTATLSPPTEAEVMEAAARHLYPAVGCNSDPDWQKPDANLGFRCRYGAQDVIKIQIKVLNKAGQGNNRWKVDVEATPMPLISVSDLSMQEVVAFGMGMNGAFDGPNGLDFKKGVALPAKRASLTLESKGSGWYVVE